MMVVLSLSMTTFFAVPRSSILHILQTDSEIFRDRTAFRENRDVFHHRLAAIAESWRLDGSGLQRPAQPVDHKRRERFAFDIFGNDQQRSA